MSIPQPRASSPWGQSESPSQSCSGFGHSRGTEPQGKRPPHGGSWAEPVGTGSVRLCFCPHPHSRPPPEEGLQGEPKALEGSAR